MNTQPLTPWFRPAGIELTRILFWESRSMMPASLIKKFANKKEWQIENMMTDYAFNTRKFAWRTIFGCYINDNWVYGAGKNFEDEHSDVVQNVGNDPCCIEVQSRILQNWEMTKKFFTLTDEFLDNHGFLRNDEDIAGTGGHIHIGLTPSLIAAQEESTQILRMMLNHPEIMFAFADPRDDHHGLNNLNKTNDVNGYYKNSYLYNDNLRTYTYKGGPIAYRGETVEFRCLDIAQTWEMQEEHMAFAQAFVRYCLESKKILGRKCKSREEIELLTVHDHCLNFEKLIYKLNLPWKRYKWYIHNIKTRFELQTHNFGD